MDDLDVVSFLMAAAVHDFRHFGYNNGFLVNSKHKLALRYNDKSVLESWHVAEAFKVAQQFKDCDIFAKLSDS